MNNFEPVIVAFVCNWCSYGGADQAGGQKFQYPANVKLVRVMCSGRIDTRFIIEAFRQGADGVMVLGCHPGDCHYRNGNLKMQKRVQLFKRLLGQMGIEPERCLQDWVAASEGKKFQELAVIMTDTIKKIGPLNMKGPEKCNPGRIKMAKTNKNKTVPRSKSRTQAQPAVPSRQTAALAATADGAGSGVKVTVLLDGKSMAASPGETIFNLIQKSGASLLGPAPMPETGWINNAECPLVNFAEVNGVLMPIKMLKTRPARDKMRINTHSEPVRSAMRERVKKLQSRHECALIRSVQELCGAEAESAGFVNLEERSKWRFADRSSQPSILHEANKCIRCEACVNTCRDLQGVDAITKDTEKGISIDEDKCVRCGQCTLTCPMGATGHLDSYTDFMGCRLCPYSRPLGAMREIDDTGKVLAVLQDPGQYPVVQFAPAVRATLGEAFGLPASIITRKLYAALRKAGFKKIWDTNFAADLTIMEEGSELIQRISHGGVLPQFTSCCPGWINFIERYYPALLPNLSTAKSPQQMFGAVAKTYAAGKLKLAPEKMTVVSIMPCTAKKYEAMREEMKAAAGYWRKKGAAPGEFRDVDIVLTSRETVKLLKMLKINLAEMKEEDADSLLGEYTGAAPIFGRTGGVMEAALRTAYELITKQPLEELEFESLGGFEGVKKAAVAIGGLNAKVAVVHGLKQARQVCESIQNHGEFSDYHFIEFMCCSGGCVGGGGQLIPANLPVIQTRTHGVNRDDREKKIRRSHENEEIKIVYRDFLEEPLGHLAHELLHTHYTSKKT